MIVDPNNSYLVTYFSTFVWDCVFVCERMTFLSPTMREMMEKGSRTHSNKSYKASKGSQTHGIYWYVQLKKLINDGWLPLWRLQNANAKTLVMLVLWPSFHGVLALRVLHKKENTTKRLFIVVNTQNEANRLYRLLDSLNVQENCETSWSCKLE